MKDRSSNGFRKERKINSMTSLLFHTIYIFKDGYFRGRYLKQKNAFHSCGENLYYHPRKVPADAYMVSIGDNVSIATDVNFVVHDVFSQVFNRIGEGYTVYFSPIIIKDNVCIGGGCTYNARSHYWKLFNSSWGCCCD